MPSQGWWGHTRGTIATPGYSIFLTPWAGVKGGTANTRSQTSILLGGGYFWTNPIAVNNDWSTDAWFDAGTYKFALIHYATGNAGIYTVKLDGSSQGTIDGFGAAANTYSEITGIAVTAGLKVVQVISATKNAGSSDYGNFSQTASWIRTGA